MLKKFVLGGMVVVAALLGNACGDDGSSDSPAGPADSEVTLSSSSDDVIPGNGSSSSVTESPSTSSGQAPQSAESDGSSSSEKAVDGSSSSDGKTSSSSGKVESSSSEKAKSSSSEGAAGSSSSDVVAGSSSSEKSSSSVAGFSSSVENSSSKESSSSSVVESSSSVAESSSSSEDDVSSSSEYYKLSWDYLNPSIPYDTIIDSRDGQVYKVVTIDKQTWMAENLNYYDTLQHPELKTLSWCFNDKNINCDRRGRLYKHPAAWNYEDGVNLYKDVYKKMYQNENGKFDSLLVQGICPDGWRIPTRSEWIALSNKCDIRSEKWGGTNKCGISVFASGWRSVDADDSSLVEYVGGVARFWTSTWYSGFTSLFEFGKNGPNDVIGSDAPNAHSLRCIKDN